MTTITWETANTANEFQQLQEQRQQTLATWRAIGALVAFYGNWLVIDRAALRCGNEATKAHNIRNRWQVVNVDQSICYTFRNANEARAFACRIDLNGLGDAIRTHSNLSRFVCHTRYEVTRYLATVTNKRQIYGYRCGT